MNLFHFLLTFLTLLVIGGLCIVGFYGITRGHKELQPDGTVKHSGKLLKHWSLFWEQKLGERKVYFTGAALKEKLQYLAQYNPPLAQKMLLLDTPEGYKVLTNEPLIAWDETYIQENLQCEVEHGDQGLIRLYRHEPDYVFPEWVRFPMSQCPPCMASIGGTMLYFPTMLQMDKLLDWSQYPAGSLFFFWIVYCCALAAVNKFFHHYIEG